jgi:spore maturation protein CgeB
VATFWDEGDVSHYSRLRRDVTFIVQAMHKTKTGARTIRAHVGVLGNNKDGMDQGNIQLDYVEHLLDSKLVVVTQRDEWEDNLRLYDSLASGALVLTDHMHTLPAGFVNKTNILVYDSPQSLRRLIRYYLHPNNSKKRNAIAKSGWKLAMSRHRSFHRVEQILFGQAMTLPDLPSPNAHSPPKRAHPVAQVTNHESFYMR